MVVVIIRLILSMSQRQFWYYYSQVPPGFSILCLFYPPSNRHLIESGSELEPLEAVPVDLLEQGHQLDGEVDKDSAELSFAKNLEQIRICKMM